MMSVAATKHKALRVTKSARIGGDPSAMIGRIRKGVPATALPKMAVRLKLPKRMVYGSLSIPPSTVDRLISNEKRLSPEYSERVLGVQALEELVRRLIEESGTSKGFDASAWLGAWINEANPALGGEKPASYLDTMTGQTLVKQLLLRSQSGAFG